MTYRAQKAAAHAQGSCHRHLNEVGVSQTHLGSIEVLGISEELCPLSQSAAESPQGVRMNPACAGVCLQPTLGIMASPLPKSEMMHIFSWWQDQGTRQGREFLTLEMYKRVAGSREGCILT